MDIPSLEKGQAIPAYCLREAGGPKGGREEKADEFLAGGEGGRRLVCKACRGFVTTVESRTSVAGKHRHVFCNPHGFVYEVGCFSIAPGCRTIGPPSSEFSWFAGYAWSIAVCSKCQSHLGWRFTSEMGGGLFYGLVIDHLAEEEDGED